MKATSAARTPTNRVTPTRASAGTRNRLAAAATPTSMPARRASLLGSVAAGVWLSEPCSLWEVSRMTARPWCSLPRPTTRRVTGLRWPRNDANGSCDCDAANAADTRRRNEASSLTTTTEAWRSWARRRTQWTSVRTAVGTLHSATCAAYSAQSAFAPPVVVLYRTQHWHRSSPRRGGCSFATDGYLPRPRGCRP